MWYDFNVLMYICGAFKINVSADDESNGMDGGWREDELLLKGPKK